MRLLFLLLIAWASSCVGFFFPSPNVKICNATQHCEYKLLVLAEVGNEGSDWELDYIISSDTVILDSLGRQFAPAKPISLRLARRNNRIEYPLTYRQTVKNAYEGVEHHTGIVQCPAAAKCCSDTTGYTVHRLKQNDTLYDVYAVQQWVNRYDLIITATQDTTTYTLELSGASPSGTLPSLSATIDQSAVPQFAQVYGEYLVYDTSKPISENFMLVGSNYFGDALNRIGISESTFLSGFTCNKPVGYFTTIGVPNTADQFSLFRSHTLQSEIFEYCTLSTQFSVVDKDTASPHVAYVCQDTGVVMIFMELDTKTFWLKKLFGEARVTNSGVFPLKTTDTRAILFIDISNQSEYPGVFEVRPRYCCLHSATASLDCTSLSIQSAESKYIDPYTTERVLFYLGAQSVINKSGYCVFDIVQHGFVELSNVTVTFDTKPIDYLDPNSTVADSTNPCRPPQVNVTRNGVVYCITCTLDQVPDSSAGICTPVDCIVKYRGVRNWYNPRTGLCEPAAVCTKTQVYDSVNNVCRDTALSGNGTTAGNWSALCPNCTLPPPASPALTPIDIQRNRTTPLQCGAHGRPSSDNMSCICDTGWRTVPTSADVFEWCSAKIQGEGAMAAGDPVAFFSGGGTFQIVFIAAVCGVGSCVLGCCVYCACKCYRKRKRRREKRQEKEVMREVWQHLLRGKHGAKAQGTSEKSSASKAQSKLLSTYDDLAQLREDDPTQRMEQRQWHVRDLAAHYAEQQRRKKTRRGQHRSIPAEVVLNPLQAISALIVSSSSDEEDADLSAAERGVGDRQVLSRSVGQHWNSRGQYAWRAERGASESDSEDDLTAIRQLTAHGNRNGAGHRSARSSDRSRKAGLLGLSRKV